CARMPLRVGSARAAKTSCATASWSRPGIEVVNELAQFPLPALGVAAVGNCVRVAGQLREAGLDHRQPGARGVRLQRELDVGAARVVLRQAEDGPRPAEHPWRLQPLDTELVGVLAVPGDL